ncbi:MAG: hypothetical protein IJR34_07655 [Bacteroidales bacterium]|nr:hypothetical protein [Bacteroidales bacterium]
MAFDKNKITQQLVTGFGKIASEATAQNPATKIVADTIAAAIETALADVAVTGSATVDGKTGTISGTLQ